MTFDIKKIEEKLKDFPKYRLSQLRKEIFGRLIEDWDDSITLPKDLLERLQKESLNIQNDLYYSKDKKSARALIKLSDNEKIETVLIKSGERNTICVSTQVGCPVGCLFCDSGKLGFTRNLTASEIILQVLLFQRLLRDKDQKVTNVVFMGIGEPFLNYDNVIEAINYLNDKDTLNLGIRRFSISTSGIIPGIEKFTRQDSGINLAISLHAPTDEIRSEIMPINNKYPIHDLIEAVVNYQNKTNRKVMFEYIMIDGLNDTIDCANSLVKLIRDIICVVNLIPCNDTSKYKPSSKESIQKFKDVLANNRIIFTERAEVGSEIFAACGQLALKKKS